MQKKKLRILWPVLIIVLLLVALCFLFPKGEAGPHSPADSLERPDTSQSELLAATEVDQVTVYFAASTEQVNLVPLALTVNKTRSAASVALEKLLAGPPNEFLAPVANDGAKLKDLYQENDIIYVDLTSLADTVDLSLLFPAVSATLDQLLPDMAVQLLLDGEPLPAPYDTPQKAAPVNYWGSEKEQNGPCVTIYLADNQGMYLVPVTLPVEEATPAVALASLAAGSPSGCDLLGSMVPDCRISLEEIKDGKAVVNLSKDDWTDKESDLQERLMLDAILATLGQFEDITAVQFLVNGEAAEYLPGGIDIHLPLPALKVPACNVIS